MTTTAERRSQPASDLRPCARCGHDVEVRVSFGPGGSWICLDCAVETADLHLEEAVPA